MTPAYMPCPASQVQIFALTIVQFAAMSVEALSGIETLIHLLVIPTSMAKQLSPAAQAVLDAYRSSHLSINNLAAALRAAADQVVPDEPAPTGMRPAGDVYSAREIRRGQRQVTRSQLLAIASELEAQ